MRRQSRPPKEEAANDDLDRSYPTWLRQADRDVRKSSLTEVSAEASADASRAPGEESPLSPRPVDEPYRRESTYRGSIRPRASSGASVRVSSSL